MVGTCVYLDGLGPYNDVNVYYFKGSMDEIKIYNRALHPDAIFKWFY